mmetsp:Transcript_15634/g.22886  ORF Transcript_15634/g.22886 Transcript_15634/m.22886 type:complete len:119 (-) Transcript_15634:5-361(-)
MAFFYLRDFVCFKITNVPKRERERERVGMRVYARLYIQLLDQCIYVSRRIYSNCDGCFGKSSTISINQEKKRNKISEIRFRALLLLFVDATCFVRCSFFFPSHVPNQEYLILKVVCSF